MLNFPRVIPGNSGESQSKQSVRLDSTMSIANTFTINKDITISELDQFWSEEIRTSPNFFGFFGLNFDKKFQPFKNLGNNEVLRGQ